MHIYKLSAHRKSIYGWAALSAKVVKLNEIYVTLYTVNVSVEYFYKLLFLKIPGCFQPLP